MKEDAMAIAGASKWSRGRKWTVERSEGGGVVVWLDPARRELDFRLKFRNGTPTHIAVVLREMELDGQFSWTSPHD